MGNKGATFAKRQREQASKDRAREKAQRREEKARKPQDERAAGTDPDIDWIVPGPQPIPEE